MCPITSSSPQLPDHRATFAALLTDVWLMFVLQYGRKTLFMMVCCQNCLISLGIAFVGDIRSYWVLRFLSRFYIEVSTNPPSDHYT